MQRKEETWRYRQRKEEKPETCGKSKNNELWESICENDGDTKEKIGWKETESTNEEHKFRIDGETEKEGWTEGEFDEREKKTEN